MVRVLSNATLPFFPLDETQIPASALEALSPLSTEGPPQTEEYAPPTMPPPDLSETQLDGFVYAQAQTADGTLHTNVPGTSGGALACAWAVNEVVRRALGRPIGGGLSTANMYDVLRTKHHMITEAQSQSGTIIISPTVGNNHGHVGIVGSRGAGAPIGSTIIYSNIQRGTVRPCVHD